MQASTQPNGNLFTTGGSPDGDATVYVSFVVTHEGKVTMVEILRGIPNESGLDKSIIKAFENMPLWKPGRNGTKNVSVRMRVPIKFKTR
jgi:TonB family protein